MSSRDRFISVLLRPFAGTNEQELEGRRLVGQWLDETEADENGIEAATKRFEDADARRARRLRNIARPTLVAAALIALLLPVSVPIVEAIRHDRLDSGVAVLGNFWYQCNDYFPTYGTAEDPNFDAALVRGLNPEQALMLRGDPEIRFAIDRAEALWRDHFPDDPAFYYDYLRWHVHRRGELPENGLETAERLDPENGYVALTASSLAAEQALKRRSRKDPKYNPKGKVQDEEQFARALKLFHDAASKPVCTGRADTLGKMRTAGFRPTTNASTWNARFFWQLSQPRYAVSPRRLREMIEIETERLEESGDRRAMSRLAMDWQNLVKTLATDPDNPLDVIVAFNIVPSSGKCLLKTCQSMRLDEQAGQIEAILAGYRGPQPKMPETHPSHPDADSLRKSAGLSAHLMLFVAFGEPLSEKIKIDPADLTPGRLAEYCNVDWLAIRAAGLLMLLFAGFAAMFWRYMSQPSWILGKRLAQSLGASDWAWILGLGVLAPLVWHGFITRVPAFRTRDFGMPATIFFQPLLQEIATLLLILSAMIQTSRWRLARRLRVLGFRTKRLAWFGWMPVAAAALALPLTALPVFVPDSSTSAFTVVLLSRIDPAYASLRIPIPIVPLIPAAILLTGCFLWLAGLFLGVFIGRAKRTPFRAAASFVFASACAPAALVLALGASPLVKLEFGHWLARDTVLDIRPEWNGMTKYEFLYTKGIQDRMLRALKEN